MKVVIDTNVFISGIFWSGAPSQVLTAWQSNKFDMAITQEILEEYQRVAEILSKKHPTVDIIPIIELVATKAKLYKPVKLGEQISRDPDDDKFIACALAAKTNLIVTGDDDLLSINGHMNLSMIKPRAFLNNFLN